MDLDKRNKLWVKIGKLFFAPLTILIAATYCNSNASLVSARMAVDRQQTDLPAQMDQKEITELNTQEIFADAPFTPNNLKVLKSSSKSIIVGWDEVNDHVEVSGYQVFVDGLLVGSTTATSFKITELKSSTWYTISIRAIDNEGNGSDEAVLLAPTYGANLLFNANFVEPGESDSLAKYWNPYVSTGTSKVIEVVNTPTGIAQKISAVSLQASGSYLGMYQLIQVEPNKPFVMSAILDIEQLSNAVVSLLARNYQSPRTTPQTWYQPLHHSKCRRQRIRNDIRERCQVGLSK